jgi:protein SCO1/2
VPESASVYYKRIPTSGGYVMDHTAILYLMDASGKFVGPIAYQEKTASTVVKLKKLAAQGVPS